MGYRERSGHVEKRPARNVSISNMHISCRPQYSN
jgi:hypothetical protein